MIQQVAPGTEVVHRTVSDEGLLIGVSRGGSQYYNTEGPWWRGLLTAETLRRLEEYKGKENG